MAQVPKSTYDPESFGQGNAPQPGKYHAVITKSEEPNQNGQCLVQFQVLSGTTPKQEGKTIDDRYFPFNEKAADRLKHLWYITGAASLAEINSGEDVPMSKLLGKQLLIEISMSKERVGNDGKTYPPRPQVGWRPESIQCMVNGWEAVPRHQGALQGQLEFGSDTPMPPQGGQAGGDPFDFG